MADAGAAPPLPTQKTPGWEFTDLSGLDLGAYTAADGGDPEARPRADAVLNPPRREPTWSRWTAPLSTAPRSKCGRRRPPVRAAGGPAGRRPRALPAPARDARPPDRQGRSLRRPQRRRLAWRSAGLRPARQAPGGPAQIAAVQDADGLATSFRTLIVARGGRRGRGLGAVALHRLKSGRRLQHRHRDLGRPRRQPALRHRPGPRRARAGSSAPSEPRWSATRTSTGSPWASARHAARSGWRRRSPEPARAPGDRRLRRQRQPSTSTSTPPRSMPRRTPPRTSPSAASSRSRPPPSGAG